MLAAKRDAEWHMLRAWSTPARLHCPRRASPPRAWPSSRGATDIIGADDDE
jgi:hypothetical protein